VSGEVNFLAGSRVTTRKKRYIIHKINRERTRASPPGAA